MHELNLTTVPHPDSAKQSNVGQIAIARLHRRFNAQGDYNLVTFIHDRGGLNAQEGHNRQVLPTHPAVGLNAQDRNGN